MVAVLLCLFWMMDFVFPASMDGSVKDERRSHDLLRSATSRVSSLGDSDNAMLNEIKEIITLLSQKVDNSEQRIQSLEGKISSQEQAIKNLETDVNEASSFHRYLQTTDSECLPRFRETPFGPRCDFSYVTRFQNRTFFNDDVVFNEGVEFDSDANCMPTFNSTSRMCTLSNNFTFDLGDIVFNNSVQFDDDAEFNDHVSFYDPVRFESEVDFDDDGEVVFRKKARFREDVHIQNDDHDIELRLEDKVTARFYMDRTFKIDTYTTFYEDVKMEKDLKIKKKLAVSGKTTMDDLEVYGWMWVGQTSYLDGELKANHGAVVKSGVKVESGGLEVSDGAIINGTITANGQLNANHRAVIRGGLNVATGGLDVVNGADISGGLEVRQGAKIFGLLNAKTGVEIDGGLLADFAQIGSTPISRRLKAADDKPALKVVGDIDVTGGVTNFTINMDQFVNDLMLYPGDVTIPNLRALEFRVISTIVDGKRRLGRMRYRGKEVAIAQDVLDLQAMIQSLPTASPVEAPSCDCPDIDISVIVTPELLKNMGFVQQSDLDVLELKFADSPALAPVPALIETPACACPEVDVTSLVTEEFLQDIVNANYVSRMGFVQEGALKEVEDALKEVEESIPDLSSFTPAPPVEDSCTCGRSDVEKVVTYDYLKGIVNETYVSAMDFVKEDALKAVEEQIPDASPVIQTPSCTCPDPDIEGVVTSSFIEELFGVDTGSGFVFKNDLDDAIEEVNDEISNLAALAASPVAAPSCDCPDIEGVVTSTYIEGLLGMDESLDFGTLVTKSDLDGAVEKVNVEIANLATITATPVESPSCTCPSIEDTVDEAYVREFVNEAYITSFVDTVDTSDFITQTTLDEAIAAIPAPSCSDCPSTTVTEEQIAGLGFCKCDV